MSGSRDITKVVAGKEPCLLGPAWPLGPPADTGGAGLPAEPGRHRRHPVAMCVVDGDEWLKCDYSPNILHTPPIRAHRYEIRNCAYVHGKEREDENIYKYKRFLLKLLSPAPCERWGQDGE